MRYFDLREKFNKFAVFSLNDIRKIDPNFNVRRISEWTDKDLIRRIRRGFYIFTDTPLKDETTFLIANKIYHPSYVSYETALSRYGVIPEAVFGITSATTLKTQNFNTPAGNFIYRHVKPSLFFGYQIVQFQDYSYKQAYLEKAVLDYLYHRPELKNYAQFRETRFNVEKLRTEINKKRFLEYVKRFENKALSKRANNFMNYINLC